jgi:hypothetical protein
MQVCTLQIIPGLQRGDAKTKLAVSDLDSPAIHIFDIKSGSNEAIDTLNLHSMPVTAMRFNEPHDTVISADKRGRGQQPEGQGRVSQWRNAAGARH